RLVRLRRGLRIRGAADDVDPAGDTSAKERLRAVDTGVEQCDGDTAAVLRREPELGWMAEPWREVAGEPRGDRGRVRRSHGVDAADLRRALQQCQPVRVECGREAVDGARVAVLRLHRDALCREA